MTQVVFTSRKLAKSIAEFASDKKAEEIVVLDMRKIVSFCDYFVVCSGNTDRQVNAIAKHIDASLGDLGIGSYSKQGMKKGDWVVFDAGDVVVHIFKQQLRQFYNLEYLWQEAKPVNLPAAKKN